MNVVSVTTEGLISNVFQRMSLWLWYTAGTRGRRIQIWKCGWTKGTGIGEKRINVWLGGGVEAPEFSSGISVWENPCTWAWPNKHADKAVMIQQMVGVTGLCSDAAFKSSWAGLQLTGVTESEPCGKPWRKVSSCLSTLSRGTSLGHVTGSSKQAQSCLLRRVIPVQSVWEF